MSLQTDRTLVQLAAFAGTFGVGPLVGEVGDLVAVYPGRHVIASRCHGHREPFAVAGNDLACGLAIVDAPRTVVHCLRPIISLPLIADLRLIAAPEFTRQAAEEYATIEMRAVGKDFDLKHEV